MERAMAAFEAPGAAVAVAVHGEVVWAAAFGLADTEAGVPACPETAFRVGSVSKSITAAALARLLDAGAIDLDSTVGDLLPDLPRELHSITVAQLGHHQSGIRHYRTSGEVVNRQHFDSVAAGLSIFAGSPLLFEPGTSSSYSSYGYNLLGALLEAVTGDDYGSLVERQVLDVVGMISTTPDDASVQPPARARPYERLAVAQVVPAPVADLSDRLPSGGWSASASDLARLGAALLDDSFISPDAQDALFADAALPDGETTGYGIGFEVACNPPGPCLAMQTGAVVGGSALLLIDRANGVVAAIVMNVGTATATSAPPPAQPPPDPPELLAPFGGAG
ncbi:MAG: beta-lactamase family protein [Chloroflexota bacterium]|nr:beta-lactamase family protein [Chloroflexota bacterium]